MSKDHELIDAESGQPASVSKVIFWRWLTDHPLITPEVLHWKYAGAGTEEDPYVVTWIDNDPRNPMLLSPLRKASITGIVAICTLGVSLISSTYSGALNEVREDFHVGAEVATLGLALYVVGFAVGPIGFASLSELYGRQVVFFITYGCFVAFNGGIIASQNIWTLCILRFFAGTFGASTFTNTGGTISDMYVASSRGLAMSLFAAAPFMGPVFGPLIGGFLGQAAGWRWVQALVTIFSGIMWGLATFNMPETYAPLLLRKRAAKLSQMTGKVYRSRIELQRSQKLSARQEFKNAFVRPWLLMIYEPIVLFLSIYMSIVYGTLYLFLAAIPIVFQEHRGWNEGQCGLAFMGIAVGMILALIYCIPDNIRYQKHVAMKGPRPPEERLIIAMVGSIWIPIGLFWFAWTNSPSVQWMASIAGGAPYGFGLVLIFVSIKNYLVDGYTLFAASALAATVIMRSFFAAAFPLFTDYMFAGIGIHWASSIPAFLSLLCTPLPFIFYWWGAKIRSRCKFAAQSEELRQKMLAK